MATTGNYTAITGSWTVPHATGITGKTSDDSAWIGIGGVTAADLIQVGTEDSVSASGREKSVAFYELLPQTAHTISTLSISAGDSMSASLSETTANQWKISITDTTTGGSFVTTVSYTSSHSSAEWIEEDPSSAGGLIPFDTFTPILFTNATTTSSTTSDTILSSNAQPVTLISGTTHNTLATPSGIGSDGQSFTITRD